MKQGDGKVMDGPMVGICRWMMRKIISSDDNAIVFCSPVDTKTYPDYLEVIAAPVDFQTIDRRLCATANKMGVKVEGIFADEIGDEPYSTVDHVVGDMIRVFENCKKYNGKGKLWSLAENLEISFRELCNAHLYIDEPQEHFKLVTDQPVAPWDVESDEGTDSSDVSEEDSEEEDSTTLSLKEHKGSAKPRRDSRRRERKRPIRDLRGAEVLFECAASVPEYTEHDEVDLVPHFEKLQSILDWLSRIHPQGTAPVATWRIEVIRRTAGATVGSLDSYFVTPEWKRLRSRKDVATFLNLPAEEDCTIDIAHKAMVAENGHLFSVVTTETPSEYDFYYKRAKVRLGERVILHEPIELNEFVTVLSLGRIVDSSKFSNRRNLWTLGFKSQCTFLHRSLPGRTSEYLTEVLMNEDGISPFFRVTDIAHGIVKQATTMIFAWTLMLEDILISLHHHWFRMQLAVIESDIVCAANVMPSNSTRALAKTDDVSKKAAIIQKEVEKVLERVLKEVESMAERNVHGFTEIEKSFRKRQLVTIKDLIRLGLVDPQGPGITLDYQENFFRAAVNEDGHIVYKDNVYESPSSFSITVKRSINPTKAADCGWKSVKYDGQSLDTIRQDLTADELENIEQFHEEERRSAPSNKITTRRRHSYDDAAEHSDMDEDEELEEGEESVSGSGGIGEKNYLRGAQNLHKLPQPHHIKWYEVELTPMINEYLWPLLTGFDVPELLDVLEALPLLDDVDSYEFRLQREKSKGDYKLRSKHVQSAAKVEKAISRILKHVDAVDRRTEAAARRQMRIEDRHSRNWRIQLKKEVKVHSAQVRREDMQALERKGMMTIEALHTLLDEIQIELKKLLKGEPAELTRVTQGIKSKNEIARLAQKSLDSCLRKLRGIDVTESDEKRILKLNEEYKRAVLELQQSQLALLTQLKVKLQHGDTSLVQDLAQFQEDILNAGNLLETFLDFQVARKDDKYPNDQFVQGHAKPLTVSALKPIYPLDIAEDLLSVWDFFSKFAPDLSLCDKPEMLDGMFGLDDIGVDDEEEDQGEAEDENYEEDEDEEEEEEPAVVEQRDAAITVTPKKKRKSKKIHYLEGYKRTPIVFLSEIREIIRGCNMHFLAPVHLMLVETLFIGSACTREDTMSDAARERSISGRRYTPLNQGTWQECLRLFFMFLCRQLESPHENVSVKELLHNVDASWSCIMFRKDDNEEDEEAAMMGSNARRLARRDAKVRHIAFRDEAMRPLAERINVLSVADYSGSRSAELLLHFPEHALATSQQGGNSNGLTSTVALAAAASNNSNPGPLVPPEVARLSKKHGAMLPAWAQVLLQVKDMPTNRGSRIKVVIEETVTMTLDNPELSEMTSRLRKSISQGTFKSNAAGNCKRMAMNALAEYIMSFNFNDGSSKKRKAAALVVQVKKVRPARVARAGDLLDWDTTNRCRAVVREVSRDGNAGVFSEPVSLEDFPDYLDHVEVPMDLQTIDIALSEGRYGSVADVLVDIDTIWDNCMAFNQQSSFICKVARQLDKLTKTLWKAWVDQDSRALKKHDFVYIDSLPEAMWGLNDTTVFCKENPPPAGTTAFADDGKKRKKKKISLSEYVLSETLKSEGYEMQGLHVGSRVARKLARGSVRGTVVAFSESKSSWHVNYDDGGESEDMNEEVLHDAQFAYDAHASKKKIRKDRKRKKESKGDDEDDELPVNSPSDIPDNSRSRPVTPTEENTPSEANVEEQELEEEMPADDLMEDDEDVNVLLLENDKESFIGTILVRYFEDGCAEGYVSSLSDDGMFTLKFTNEVELIASLEEVIQMEKDSILLKVGSEKNGKEEAENELRMLEVRDAPEPVKTRHGVNLEGTITVDPCNPTPMNRFKEIALLKRLIWTLSTESYESISFTQKTQIMRFICEQVCECGFIRGAIQQKMHVAIKTTQQWRLTRPMVDRDPEVVKLEKDIDFMNKEGVLDRMSGEGVSEQCFLLQKLSNFRIKHDTHISETLSRSIEKLQRAVEKERNVSIINRDQKVLRNLELEWKLQLVATSHVTLGHDRYFNKYIYFPGDHMNIYVNVSEYAIHQGVVSQPGWYVVASRQQLNSILNSLNIKGGREKQLFNEIQARSNLLMRDHDWFAEWETGEFGVKTEKKVKDEVKDLRTLVGKELDEKKNQPFSHESFYNSTFSSQIVDTTAHKRHIIACRDAAPLRLQKSEALEDMYLMDLKVILLDLEYAVVLTKTDEVSWLGGNRKGWIRLVTSGSNWRDLRQALAFLELAFDSVPLENWYMNLYGDCGYALRCKSSSSLASRIMALDSAVNHSELNRLQSIRARSKSKSNKKKK